MRPITVIGPQNPISDGAVRDQCAIANIPHIQAVWQPLDTDLDEIVELEEEDEEGEEAETGEEAAKETNGQDAEQEDEPVNEETDVKEAQSEEITLAYKNISINFYPYSDEINIAFAKLLDYYGWESFAVLYEEDLGINSTKLYLT